MKITIAGRADRDDLPDVTIGIEVQINISDDAPPTLVNAIGRSLGELLTSWGREDEVQQIVRECEEIRARRQRQADHTARLLLGDEEPEDKPDRLCGRCGRMRDDVERVRYKQTDPDPELRGSEEFLCGDCYIEVIEQYDDSDDAPTGVEDLEA